MNLIFVDRFISVYENHGLSVNEIPLFVKDEFDFKLTNFKDCNSILDILSDNFIDWTCNRFGIQAEWIYGKSNKIYINMNYYKGVNDLHGNKLELFFIRSRELTPQEFGQSYVIVIFRFPIKIINNTIIYKYIPISTNWDWGYWRSRYQLKAIIYTCEKLGIFSYAQDMLLS